MDGFVTITVKGGGASKRFAAKKGGSLMSALVSQGYFVSAPCGGRGRCGKCKVKLLSGAVDKAQPDAQGFVLSCLARLREDITVEFAEATGSGLTLSRGALAELDGGPGYGIALDIGTTTLAFYLMDLADGREIDAYSCLNPQGAFGADVISRISACAEGKLGQLNALIVGKVNEVIAALTEKHGIGGIDKLTACGNTTMLHLFAGEDASLLGVYPFIPAFTEMRRYEGGRLGVRAGEVVLLPSIAAYVGSDIVAGILSTGMVQQEGSLLIDIGTNGEIALNAGGKLYCASTAAGPALEGANISCGMGGVAGAIDSARIAGGRLNYTVIGDGEKKGICGSGLIDIISIMLELRVIDETGAFCDGAHPGIRDDKFYITGEIFISQQDVRQFQLAKSAICAGIKAIAAKADISLEDVGKAYVAGGMGYYIDYKNAIRTGLLPKQLDGKIEVVGNSAGAGAKMCLLSKRQLELSRRIAGSCENVELSAEPLFMEEYVNSMGFEG